MTLLKPFKGYCAKQSTYHKVIAPPYDVLNFDQAAAIAAKSPASIVHATRAEVDCPGLEFDHPDCYKQAKNSLKQLIASQFDELESSCYFIYRISNQHTMQTGIAGVLHLQQQTINRLKTHEHTRPKKVADRSALLQTLQAQISPVLLTIHNDENLQATLNSMCQQPCFYDADDDQGYRHQLWLTTKGQTGQIEQCLESISDYYIADGHHRCAAALDAQKAASDKTILSVVFPQDQLSILGYHRVIRSELSSAQIIEQISQYAVLTPMQQPHLPQIKGQFGLYIDSNWYLLLPNTQNQLDVTTLHQQIIEPIFSITDPREDNRIDFIGGSNALSEIENNVNNGEYTLGFTLFPTQIQEVMQVADANEVMPPKSTWFEPKLLDGFFIASQ